MKTGLLALGRPTFDVPFAEEMLAAMLSALEGVEGIDLVGPRNLLFDGDATMGALDQVISAGAEQILILQVTFTDAAMTVEIAGRFDGPLMIWAPPEPRLGGRLRLNAFCGLNLASHALGLRGRRFGWLYADPRGDVAADLAALLAGARMVSEPPAPVATEATAQGRRIVEALAGRRIGRIGAHPDGFDTCAYDAGALRALTGVSVDALELPQLFDAGRGAAPGVVADLRARVDGLAGIEEVDQAELDRSLRLKAGLDQIRAAGAYDAFALRCWPETFTEYGGAVCGAAAMLGETKVPCACEADVYGAATQLLMQTAADAPVFLVDVVDIDLNDDSGVVWHCGQAPLSMADPDHTPEATIHTNRKMPLLYQFPLKPGPVTMARISQAHGAPKMILMRGEMLKRPMAFTGTSGVLRFDAGAAATLSGVMESGLEHHVCLAYGDHTEALRGAAGAMGLPVLQL